MGNSIKEIEKKIIPILKKNNIKRAGIFGSYARGEQERKSDVDILIEADSNLSLYDIIGIKLELEEKLRKKADLAEYETIRNELKKGILDEEISMQI